MIPGSPAFLRTRPPPSGLGTCGLLPTSEGLVSAGLRGPLDQSDYGQGNQASEACSPPWSFALQPRSAALTASRELACTDPVDPSIALPVARTPVPVGLGTLTWETLASTRQEVRHCHALVGHWLHLLYGGQHGGQQVGLRARRSG